MPTAYIARLSWDEPNGAESVIWMASQRVVTFGRSAACTIPIGRVPYDDRVPGAWGRISWDRRIRVENVAERVAKWVFTLRPTFEPNAPRTEGPLDVAPGMECSLSAPQFEISACAPGGLGLTYVIRIHSQQTRQRLETTGEQPSVMELRLSPAERVIGAALIAPLDQGAALPPTYAELASATNYSREGVRDAVERIDTKLARTGLYGDKTGGKTPDRVAQALRRHRQLFF
jgi:hypothetical protein